MVSQNRNKGLAQILSLALLLAPLGVNAETDAERAMKTGVAQRDAAIAQQEVDAQKAALQSTINNQQQAQQDAAKKSKDSGQMANLLGMGLMGAGAVMVAIAMSQPTPNMAMVAAGMFMIAGGMGSMMAGQKMDNNGDQGYQNASGLGSLNTDGFKADTSSNGSNKSSMGDSPTGGKVSIDQLHAGKVGEIFDKFEAETGIKREDFAKGLEEGLSPADMLAGKNGLSKEQLQNGLDNAMANNGAGSPLGGADIEKLAGEAGLSDLYAAATEGGTEFDGSGASRATAANGSATDNKFDFAGLGKGESVTPTTEKGFDVTKLSADVQKQLAKEGRTGLTLFQLVSSRYRKVTPMMFGEDVRLNGAEAPVKNVYLDDI